MIARTRTIAASCLALSVFAAGCHSAAQSTVLGIAPASNALVTPIGSLLAKEAKNTKAAQPQTIHGTMIEKCPTAGCWFRVRDETGVIKVDTKAAGFVVSDIPLNSEVTVTGTLDSGGEKEIDATGMRCP